jgi:Zn-dependent M28 family amino/carboxypeptidase
MQTARDVLGLLMVVALIGGCRSEGVPIEADAGLPADAGNDEQYAADVTLIAGERTPGSAHWQEVQDLCAERLDDLGYEVERHAYGTGVNVIGVRRGTSIPDEQVLISGHYDSTQGCAGADDNGSGVAAVLEAARLLASEPRARTLVAACWDEEERRSDDESANGSKAYAQRARERDETIIASLALDGIAYSSTHANSQRLPEGLEAVFPTQVQQIEANDSRGDFILAVLDSTSHGFAENLVDSAEAEELPIVLFELPVDRLTDPALSELRRSDHSAFWDHDYPGMLLTDTANYRNPYYHCEEGPDTVDTLDMDFALRVVQSVTAAAARALDER